MAEQVLQTNGGWASQFRNIIPTLVLTVGVAFVTSWWHTQMAQNDMRFRLDRLEEKQKELAGASAAAALTAQQNAIRLAELGIIQSNMVEELKEIKQEHLRGR